MGVAFDGKRGRRWEVGGARRVLRENEAKEENDRVGVVFDAKRGRRWKVRTVRGVCVWRGGGGSCNNGSGSLDREE